MSTKAVTTLAGVVESVNAHGFKVSGTWVNYSSKAPKLGSEAVPRAAMKGEAVEVAVSEWNGRQFVERLRFAGAAPAQVPAPASGAGPAPAGLDRREVLIVRQSALRGAVDFASDEPGLTVDGVLAVAAAFEAWITRP